MAAQIGERRSYGGFLCTVRFAGEIPDWDVPALGVEWDDPARGKNNGDLHGKAYFECRQPQAGSFIKSSRNHDEPRSLDEALVDRYISPHPISTPRVSRTKVIETLGADKHLQRTARVERLATVSLANCRIDRLVLGHDLAALTRLDLSDNLFTSLADVTRILAPLNVEYLSLAGNRFANGAAGCVPSVRELDLARTLLGADETVAAMASFPNTHTLCLAFNQLPRWPALRVRKLDVSHNLLQSVPALDLDELNVTGNPLVELGPVSIPSFYIDTLPGGWADMAKLQCQNLRLGPPFGDQPVLVIGHLGCLQILNGSRITEQERLDAELYTLRQAASGRHDLDPERFEALVAAHGLPSVSHLSTAILARQIRVTVDGAALEIVRDASIPRLLALAARRLNRPRLGLALEHDGQVICDGLVSEYFSGGESAKTIYRD